jgi:putative transcriptional regulator
MTIRINLNALLAEKALASDRRNIPLTELERETGITWKTLQQWANNEITRYDSKTLNALCKYFDCQPGDLLTYTPDTEADGAGHD